jgi:hypothetical protein
VVARISAVWTAVDSTWAEWTAAPQIPAASKEVERISAASREAESTWAVSKLAAWKAEEQPRVQACWLPTLPAEAWTEGT